MDCEGAGTRNLGRKCHIGNNESKASELLLRSPLPGLTAVKLKPQTFQQGLANRRVNLLSKQWLILAHTVQTSWTERDLMNAASVFIFHLPGVCIFKQGHFHVQMEFCLPKA